MSSQDLENLATSCLQICLRGEFFVQRPTGTFLSKVASYCWAVQYILSDFRSQTTSHSWGDVRTRDI
jgi:hypothetical protein